MVEHLLAKEGVASSNLVFRSIFLWRRGQVVKAGVCKTPIVGSIPTVASNLADPAPVQPCLSLAGCVLSVRVTLNSGHAGVVELWTGDRTWRPQS